MDTETPTNPVEGAEGAPETEVETEGQQAEAEQQFDEDGNAIEAEPAEADDSEEVEHEGQKFKVPKAIKPLLMMHADYTRKTQEVAELRKAVEAERATIHQASAAEVQAQAQVVAIDQQLAQFQNIDWDAWEEQDPFAAAKGLRQYQQLRDARGQAAGQYVHLTQQRQLAAQQETAKRTQETAATLARDIPGWSEETKAKLTDFGMKKYGFSADEVADINLDPRIAKILNDAFQADQAATKTKAAQKHEAAQTAKPAAKVSGGSSAPTGLDDRLSPEEWVRRRNKQVKSAR
jgi:hypothetical protein